MGTSDLYANQTEVVGNLGTYYLWLAYEVGRVQSCGTKPLACGIWHYLRVDSVRIELNCKTPSWCHRELLGVGQTSTHLVTKSELFCVSSKGDTQEKYKGGKLSFSNSLCVDFHPVDSVFWCTSF